MKWEPILAFVVAIAAAYGIIFFAEEAEPAVVDLYKGIPLDERLLELDRRALDEAYHQQLLKLWGVWLAQGAQDPKYFQNGLTNVRRAYGQAEEQIVRREKELHR